MIPVPQTQGLRSSTFTQPPLDGSLTFPALFDLQGTQSAKHPLFVFEDAPGTLRTILWEEAIQAIHRATQFVLNAIGQLPKSDKQPVLAVLASSDTVTFATFLVGAMRTGCTVFPISTRNSVPAVASLISKTNSTHLFVSSESRNQGLASDALNELPEGSAVIAQHSMPVFEDLYPFAGVDPDLTVTPAQDTGINDVALIIHSSGSTAFPKPINITNAALVSAAELACHGDTDLADSVFAFHATPLFHVMGIASLVFSAGLGITVATFKPQSPAVVPNPANVYEQAVITKVDYFFITPTFIENWAKDERIVEGLKKIKGVLFAGGPLSKESGDYLASNGVNLFTGYGLTQTFMVNDILSKPVGIDWEYFKPSPAREVRFLDHGESEFEPVVLATDTYTPSVINTKVNGHDAFATEDLVTPHPTKKGYYKVVGRLDDQIMHSTGEKTNPGPLENILKTDPLINDVIIFGRGRFYCGLLVYPRHEAAFDPSDETKLVEFRTRIWATVEKMNAFAPSHSRLFKEMIIVTSQSKPFSYTPKGTPRRKAILQEYTAEIDAAYAAVDESSQTDIAGPSDWSLESTKAFVRNVVEQTMKVESDSIVDEADLFELGLDSLQATWIRNSVLRVLRDSNPSIARSLSPSFIYDHPTISQLAKHLSNAVAGIPGSTVDSLQAKRDELLTLVDKYTQAFPSFAPGQVPHSDGAVVLLTGSTGSLGSNILAKLIRTPGVNRIYTLSRPSSGGVSSKERHVKVFERETLDTRLLEDTKVQYLEGDASRADFGIDPAIFEELQANVTHIIHNAWRVNFNVSVASFESNIRSVRNFIDFSLGGSGFAPARIIFVSSIAVLQSYSENTIGPEDHPGQPDSAIGTGYGESKWVSEEILQRASRATPLTSTVARCGQLTGGPSGAWNEQEWFPGLVKSSVTLGKLPDADGLVSWISTSDAAGAVVDMLDAKEEVLNIVHPRPTSWTSIISALSKKLDIPTVPYAEWLESLEKAATSVPSDKASLETTHRSIPALQLLSMFRSMKDAVQTESREALGQSRISCAKAVAVSKSMRDAEVLGERDAERWVASWRRAGFL